MQAEVQVQVQVQVDQVWRRGLGLGTGAGAVGTGAAAGGRRGYKPGSPPVNVPREQTADSKATSGQGFQGRVCKPLSHASSNRDVPVIPQEPRDEPEIPGETPSPPRPALPQVSRSGLRPCPFSGSAAWRRRDTEPRALECRVPAASGDRGDPGRHVPLPGAFLCARQRRTRALQPGPCGGRTGLCRLLQRRESRGQTRPRVTVMWLDVSSQREALCCHCEKCAIEKTGMRGLTHFVIGVVVFVYFLQYTSVTSNTVTVRRREWAPRPPLSHCDLHCPALPSNPSSIDSFPSLNLRPRTPSNLPVFCPLHHLYFACLT